MTGPSVVRKAAAWLARGKDALPPPPPTADERRQAIAALEAAIASRAQPRRRAPSLWWQSAVAATLLLGVGFGLGYGVLGRKHRAVTVATVLSGQGRVEGQGVSHALSQGLGVQGEERVQTASGEALQVAWAGLATVTAEAESSFALLELGHQHLLRLERGAVSLEVTPLPQGERLLVETVDLSVEVRGTAFRVAIAPAPGTCGERRGTTVKVTHGLVAVREKGDMVAALGAGQSWPVCVAEAPAAKEIDVLAKGGPPGGITARPGPQEAASALKSKRLRRLRHVRTAAEGTGTLGADRPASAAEAATRTEAPGRVVVAGEGSNEGAPAGARPASSRPALTERSTREKGADAAATAHVRATAETAQEADGITARAKETALAVAEDESSETAPPASTRRSGSELGRQNDLFALALTAEAQGKSSRALSALKQLIERWPQGALAENARAEKMRLLVRMGRRSEAAAAARDYLAYYPVGFAHAEASSLLGIAPP